MSKSFEGFHWIVSIQEWGEERSRQLKERLVRLFNVNERRISRSVLYGMDLLEACSVTEGHSAASPFTPKRSAWAWGGRATCLQAQGGDVSTVEPLRSSLLSRADRLQAGDSLIKRCAPLILY